MCVCGYKSEERARVREIVRGDRFGGGEGGHGAILTEWVSMMQAKNEVHDGVQIPAAHLGWQDQARQGEARSTFSPR